VLGVADSQTREKLCFEKSLDLAKACDIVRACEASKAQLTQMAFDLNIRRPDDSVHHLADKSVKRSQGAGGGARQKTYSGGATQQLVDCSGFGRHHAKNQCLAHHVTCFSCGDKGNFSRRCPKRPQSGSRASTNTRVFNTASSSAVKGTTMQLHSVEETDDRPGENSMEEYVFHELRNEQHLASLASEWSKVLTVDGVKVTLKLDSGASCNVLPQEVFHRLPARRQRLRPGTRLRRYGAKHGYLSVLGVHRAKVLVNGAVHVVDFIVVDEPGQPSIFGLPSCQRLNLIKLVHSIKQEAFPPFMRKSRNSPMFLLSLESCRWNILSS
jgi:hypothetical protein